MLWAVASWSRADPSPDTAARYPTPEVAFTFHEDRFALDEVIETENLESKK